MAAPDGRRRSIRRNTRHSAARLAAGRGWKWSPPASRLHSARACSRKVGTDFRIRTCSKNDLKGRADLALTLVIGNKNYSSWSFRPWIAMKVAGIAFDEVVISLDAA